MNTEYKLKDRRKSLNALLDLIRLIKTKQITEYNIEYIGRSTNKIGVVFAHQYKYGNPMMKRFTSVKEAYLFYNGILRGDSK